jgi:hypothetical protein
MFPFINGFLIAFLIFINLGKDNYKVNCEKEIAPQSLVNIISDSAKLSIGLLENSESGASIRSAFILKNKEWIPDGKKMILADSSSSTIITNISTWSITYKDSIICNLKTYNEKPSIINNRSSVPMIGPISSEFSGWDNKLCYRPLVSLSSSKLLKPIFMLPNRVLPNLLDTLLIRLKEVIGDSVPVCIYNKDTHTYQKFLKYTLKDIVIDTCININNKFTLIESELELKLNKCDGLPSYCWSNFLFLIDTSGLVRLINLHNKEREYERIKLIDIADYDGDDNYEAIFWLNRYDLDGYVLFYNNFDNFSICSWSYH